LLRYMSNGPVYHNGFKHMLSFGTGANLARLDWQNADSIVVVPRDSAYAVRWCSRPQAHITIKLGLDLPEYHLVS